MANGWELEAINEQFDVFEKLTTPFKTFAVNDIFGLVQAVEEIKKKHFRLSKYRLKPVRNISAEIIKNNGTKASETHIKFSFIVLVINEEENNHLCKIPVFIKLSGNKTVYIDMNCSVYDSWEAFKNNMDLPACEFCSPAGGYYKVGKQLEIEFAKSPATLRISRFGGNKMWVLGAGALSVALSFFFKIPQSVLKIADVLMPIARKFIPAMSGSCVEPFMQLIKYAQAYKRGTVSMTELTLKACTHLKEIQCHFKDQLNVVWENLKKKLRWAYSYLSNSVSSFALASKPAQHAFLAITHKIDNDYIALETDNVEGEGENRTTIETRKYSQDSSPFCQKTMDVLSIGSNLAKHLKRENLSDLKDIFEGINSIVKVEYQDKMNKYNQSVKAATAAAGHIIDLSTFNSALGIIGDPKTHFWIETLKMIPERWFSFKINEKIEELKNNKKICITHVLESSQDNTTGIFRVIGVEGAGFISADALLDALKDVVELGNELPIMNDEIPSMITFRSQEYTIITKQELNEENTSEGSLVILRTSE